MAEVVGLAASIAGLVGITGQIGKSILFIKGFLEDARDAPEEIRSLASELELLASAAMKTDTLLVKCQTDGVVINLEEERKGLKRYANMIEILKTKIEKDIKRFGPGKGHWWERVGSATRKKSVEGYLVGVERAKSLVFGIETKIMIQLQQGHLDALIKTHQSLETLQLSSDQFKTTLSTMETQTSQISTWTGTTDQTLTTLSTEVQQINTNIKTLMPAIHILERQPNAQSELSALESMLESAVMRGMKRHQEELHKNQPTTSHRQPLREIAQNCGEKSSEDINDSLYSAYYSMIRHDETICRTSFRTPLFDIDIQTKQVQRIPKSKKGTPLRDISRFKSTNSQCFTTYNVRVKIPFWRGGMTFHSGNAGMVYGGSLSKTFRTYNFVPNDAPIMRACRDFNLPEVKRLFDAGLASPLDFNDYYDSSLVDVVLKEVAHSESRQHYSQDAIHLLKYLIHCLNGDIGGPKGLINLFEVAACSFRKAQITAMAEACRLILAHSSQDPIAGVKSFLSIEMSKTSLYQALAAQNTWWVDTSISAGDTNTSIYWETDLHMLSDPDGITIESAITKGAKYQPYVFNLGTSNANPLHLLFAIAAATREEELHRCVQSRLVLLLDSGIDPRSLSFIKSFGLREDWYIEEAIYMERPMSCIEYAERLGLETLLAESLKKVGWSTAEIVDSFEEQLLVATTELMNGEIEYRSRDENRKEFIEAIRQGEFMGLDEPLLMEICYQLENEIGVEWRTIDDLITEVNSVFKRRKTPGCWIEEDNVNLIPGKDFRLPYNCFLVGDHLKDWKCIRHIWDNELGGRVPEGYTGNVYDFKLKQWI
ncbi:hypothetical protein ONS95_002044 [Cadophora gregata]|uniref:uncharacterized protein n=1 Tax=Cadophora gregata TaxID=51156 RepID=UPI0026DAB305|nr:uncharacterized protein ONS95_002044 [Cadophora gregata]KAK0111701.1 hypothetical protein ONS95_002044 [Cadophora gregata]